MIIHQYPKYATKGGEILRYAKLKGRMAEYNMSQAELADKVGISLSAMNAKMNDSREFTVKEAKVICETLDIDDPKGYFLLIKSQKCNNIQKN